MTRFLESRVAIWSDAKTMADLGAFPGLETKRVRKQARPWGLARMDLQLRPLHKGGKAISSRKQDTNQDFLLPAKEGKKMYESHPEL